MDTWGPLFSSIVRSSIWGEPKHVRIVWVTLLALKDRNGVVETSLPGLARTAVVELEECRDAIRVLEAPDPESRSPDFEGRRIEKVDGGWRVLGHERYLKRMREVAEKVGNAKRQREFRKRVAALKNAKPLPGEEKAIAKLNAGEITTEQLDAIAAEGGSRDAAT